jgi:DNA-binding LytR/AlgR family response regulator
MKILFIEDNEHKIKQVLTFFGQYHPDIEIVLRKSYNSGLRELIGKMDFSLILLDMSLPNYDIESGETGGDYEKFAGKYLLNEMYRREIETKVLVITMYLNYVDEEFTNELKYAFPNYLGVVYFNIKEPDGWKNEISLIIENLNK